MYFYIHIHIYIYTYIYIYICSYKYIYIYIYSSYLHIHLSQCNFFGSVHHFPTIGKTMKRGHLRLAECRRVNLVLKTPSLARVEAAVSQSNNGGGKQTQQVLVLGHLIEWQTGSLCYILHPLLQIKHQAFTLLGIVLALCLARERWCGFSWPKDTCCRFWMEQICQTKKHDLVWVGEWVCWAEAHPMSTWRDSWPVESLVKAESVRFGKMYEHVCNQIGFQIY